jgi:hypothetical protein
MSGIFADAGLSKSSVSVDGEFGALNIDYPGGRYKTGRNLVTEYNLNTNP